MPRHADRSSLENSAECLRLALPQMSSRGIPVTPENYAVWYTFVCGNHPELSAAIERLDRTATAYTNQQNGELFKRFVSECDLAQFARVRSEMRHILQGICTSLNDAGNDARAYGGTLEDAVSQVETSNRMDQLHALLVMLVGETREMQENNDRMLEQFESKTREIEILQEELQRERRRAETDPLTGIANRAALMDALQAILKNPEENGPPALLMVDIDHFKRVNDTFGHLIGDRVIRFVARTLQDNVKGRDVPARYGGEEFAVALPGTDLDGAQTVAENIRGIVAAAQLVRAETRKSLGRITISIGVARYRAGEDLMEFINRADRALYASKHNGRNRVTIDRAAADDAQESA